MLTLTPDLVLFARRRRRSALKIAAALAFAAALALASCGGESGGPAATGGEAAGPAQAPGQAPAATGTAQESGSPAASPGGQATGTPTAAAGPSGAAGPATGGSFPADAPSSPQPSSPQPSSSQPSATAGSASAPAASSGGAAQTAPAGQAAAPARRLGELVYTEGTVTVHRAGGVKERVDIGDIIRQYDVIATGPKSRATIDLAAGYPGGAELKLAENTAFYFDVKAPEGEERRSVIQLLAGALAIKVDKLANGSFNVAADGAVLGVRGTVFIVDTVPDGSLLVTTNEGAVEVRSLDGRRAMSRADAAVAVPAGGSTRLLAVEPAKAAEFRAGWRNEAIAAFAPRALETASTYAKAIEDNRAAFDAALRGLKSHDATLKLWRDARAAGRVPRFADWINEKKAVSGALFDCLKALFMIERPYYRLLELKAYHDQGVGVGNLRDGRSSAAFYAGFEAANADLAADMARVREAMDLFSYAAAGSPLGEFFGSKAAGLGSGAALLGDDW